MFLKFRWEFTILVTVYIISSMSIDIIHILDQCIYNLVMSDQSHSFEENNLQDLEFGGLERDIFPNNTFYHEIYSRLMTISSEQNDNLEEAVSISEGDRNQCPGLYSNVVARQSIRYWQISDIKNTADSENNQLIAVIIMPKHLGKLEVSIL